MALTAGDKSPQNVFLRYEGGYSEDHLVPAEGDGETAPEGRGLLLVAKGDEVRPEHVALYERAEKYAAKLQETADAEEAAAQAEAAQAEEDAAREEAARTQTSGDGTSPAEEPIDTAAAPGAPVPAGEAAAVAASQEGGDSTTTSPAGDAQAEAAEEAAPAEETPAEEPAPAKKSTRRTSSSS